MNKYRTLLIDIALPGYVRILFGDAENARLENAGPYKMQGWKMQEHLVWKAVCKNVCQCYHIAVQMC